MKKILCVNKYYKPVVGGVETVVRNINHVVRDSGYEVIQLCCHNHFSAFTTRENIDGVLVIRVSTLFVLFSMPVAPMFLLYYIKYRFTSDLVWLHEPFPLSTIAEGFSSYFFKRIIFCYWHSEIVRQDFILKMLKPVYSRFLRNVDLVLVSNPKQLANSRLLKKYCANKVEVLPICVESERDVALPREDRGYFLFLGRFSYYKGLHILSEALADERLKEIQFKIVGNGKFDPKLISKLQNMNNVTLNTGTVTEAEKRDLIRESIAFLFPSTEVSEAFGIMQLEAMRQGTPVINTNLRSGVPWVSVHGVSGLTIQPKNAIELADAILTLYRDKNLWSTLSTNAIERQKKYFSEAVFQEEVMNLVKRAFC